VERNLHTGNKNDEWYTPDVILDKIREVMGVIDLDPATSELAQSSVKAQDFFTEDDDGLAHEWHGKIFCNPPYSAALIKKFTAKFYQEFMDRNMTEGIMLTNSGTDTIWNQNLAPFLQAYTLGRISFIQPDGTEKGKGGRGQVFTYVGPNPKKFVEVFTRDKFCWIPNVNYLGNL
jgi:phage N-6-adenine-methyltransferase